MTSIRMPIQPCLDVRCPVHARGVAFTDNTALTCARQILRAYDRADAIALLEQEPPLPDPGGSRVLLQIRSSLLHVGQSERITAAISTEYSGREVHQVRPERILLNHSEASQWRVDDVLIGGRSQVSPHGRLPGELFSSHFTGAGIHVFDRIARPLQVELAVTRVGGAQPGYLYGAVIGMATHEPRVLLMRTNKRVRGHRRESAQISEDCVQSIDVNSLVIDDPQDWIVHDIQLDGRSLLAQAGDIAGEMFSPELSYQFVNFGVFRAGSSVQIHASYTGDDPEGRPFAGEFRGQEPSPQ